LHAAIERTAQIAIDITRCSNAWRFVGLLLLLHKKVGNGVDSNLLDGFLLVPRTNAKAKVPLNVMVDRDGLQRSTWRTTLGEVLVRRDEAVWEWEMVESRAGSHWSSLAIHVESNLPVLDVQGARELEVLVDLRKRLLFAEREAQDWTREKDTHPIFCDASRSMRVVFWVVERMEENTRRSQNRRPVGIKTRDERPKVAVARSKKQVAVVGCLTSIVNEDFLARGHCKG
jgi:hypothetical protein